MTAFLLATAIMVWAAALERLVKTIRGRASDHRFKAVSAAQKLPDAVWVAWRDAISDREVRAATATIEDHYRTVPIEVLRHAKGSVWNPTLRDVVKSRAAEIDAYERSLSGCARAVLFIKAAWHG